MRKSAFVFLFLLTGTLLSAQEKWSLLKCYDYAIANNISIKQYQLNEKSSELVYEQNKKEQLPSLNFSGNVAYRLGRSENPTTGVYQDNNFVSSGYSLQSGVTLFNWFSRRNTIEAAKLNADADKAMTEKIKNDINKKQNQLSAHLQNLERLLTSHSTGIEKISVSTADKIIFINIADIIYCEASGAYTNIHLEGDKNILTSRTLGDFESQLGKQNFFRIHHSFLFNLNRVKEFQRYKGIYVLMENNVYFMITVMNP